MNICIKRNKFTNKSMTFGDIKNVLFVYKLIWNIMNGIFRRDKLTFDEKRNPIHNGKLQSF